MKLANLDERVHVLDAETDVFKVVRDIAQSGVQEDAFYVCDIGDVVRKHKEWKMKLPRVEPHYAVKCNDSYSVLEVLAALGTGFDCASKTEINKVLELGVDPRRIIFANPTKPASHIRHSAAVGVDLMTFDNETELHKIKSLFPSAKLVIRIRCDASVAQCQLGMKFGCDPVVEAPHLIHMAHLLGLNVVGVSFHVGSGCGDPPVFRRAIAAARNLFDFGATLGYHFHLLDLGGGYPGNKGTSIDKIAEIINSALDEYFPSPDVHIIAEPGRYYVASAYTLATNIHSKREVVDPEDNGTVSHVMYYINDGVYGSFNCLLYDHAQVTPIPMTVKTVPVLLNTCKIYEAEKQKQARWGLRKDGCRRTWIDEKAYLFEDASSGKLIPSSIWGPTCDGLDQVVENMLLPPMDVGNWIIFENMGAYTLPVASTFNGFPIPKVHTVVDGHTWLMLKDVLPLTEEHFVLGNSPANLRIGLDLGGCGEIQEWGVPPALCHQVAASESSIDQGVDHSSGPPAFLFEFVEVGPIN